VIAIIAVLIFMLPLAVQSAREPDHNATTI
jgi:hypothetical protein